MQLRKSIGASKHIPTTSDVVNYNTITNASFISLKSGIHATGVTSDPASEKYLAEHRPGGGGTVPATHCASGFCAQIPANVTIPVIEGE
jgi:hypothetical protein